MSDDSAPRVPGSTADKGKAKRLEAALRANLKRRKAQLRAQASTVAVPLRDENAAENPQNPGEK